MLQKGPGAVAPSGTRRPLLVAVTLVGASFWLAGILLGAKAFMDQERRPGDEAAVPQKWPVRSLLARSPERATLLLIAHPKCPCTRASLDQLAQIASRSSQAIRGYVLFVRPQDLPSSWAHTDLWEQATTIPGFTPIDDAGAEEAHLFGARTSGQVLLYDASGDLRFSGGGDGVPGSRRRLRRTSVDSIPARDEPVPIRSDARVWMFP